MTDSAVPVTRYACSSLMLLVMLSACSEQPICPQDGPIPAVSVRLRDQRGDTVVAGPVRGEIRDGSYRDSLVPESYRTYPTDPIEFAAGHNRPGRYTLTLEKDGFLPVERHDIFVSENSCGPITARLVIPLQPEDGQ